MRITEETTVAEIATAVPASVRVFQRHGVDFCCGGRKPLSVVCEEQGLSFAEITEAIARAGTRTADDRDWSNEPLPALIDHVVKTYHDALREELPRLQSMAAKVATVHGDKDPALRRIRDVVGELSADLRDHMAAEEAVLFPAIRAIAAGSGHMPIAAPVSVMEHEHDRAGVLLTELRRQSTGYVPPAWACGTLRALYQGLAQLEADMHVHVHLENNILFPRALQASGVAFQ